MEYSKLIWNPRLTTSSTPMMDVDADPVILIDGTPYKWVLHNDINILIEDKECLDEILSEFEDVLSGKEEEGSFSAEFMIYVYDKEKCNLYWKEDDVVACFRTQDMYDMFKSFRQYRDDFYARRS